jgi:hypothetical protein
MTDHPYTREAIERWQQGKTNIFDAMAALEDERDAARQETLEQAAIVGKGAEREMALLAKLEWTRFELLKVQSELRIVTSQ